MRLGDVIVGAYAAGSGAARLVAIGAPSARSRHSQASPASRLWGWTLHR